MAVAVAVWHSDKDGAAAHLEGCGRVEAEDRLELISADATVAVDVNQREDLNSSILRDGLSNPLQRRLQLVEVHEAVFGRIELLKETLERKTVSRWK